MHWSSRASTSYPEIVKWQLVPTMVSPSSRNNKPARCRERLVEMPRSTPCRSPAALALLCRRRPADGTSRRRTVKIHRVRALLTSFATLSHSKKERCRPLERSPRRWKSLKARLDISSWPSQSLWHNQIITMRATWILWSSSRPCPKVKAWTVSIVATTLLWRNSRGISSTRRRSSGAFQIEPRKVS